jgi:hypothetical protein
VLVDTQMVNVSDEMVEENGVSDRVWANSSVCPGCDKLPGNAGANPKQVE